MTQTHLLTVAAIGCLFLGTGISSAASISNFNASYSYAVGSGFSSTGPTVQFDGTAATVTSTTISCVSVIAGAGCAGRVLDFSMNIAGISSATPLIATIDGTVDGTTAVAGSITLTAPLAFTTAFTFGPGTFSKTLLSSSIPALLGPATSVAGYLSFSLADRQTVTLPSSLTFTVAAPSAVPEPGSLGLLASGLGAVAFFVRRRLAR